jgi:hypothetical protein
VGEFPTARLTSTAVNALQDAPLLPGVWFSPALRKDRRSWNDRATMRIDKVPRDRHVGLANRESGPLTWVAKTRRKRAIENRLALAQARRDSAWRPGDVRIELHGKLQPDVLSAARILFLARGFRFFLAGATTY